MCVLEAPASSCCLLLATDDEAGLTAQMPRSSRFPLAVLLTPLQDLGQRGGGTVTMPAGAVVDLRFERNRRATALAWHCLWIPAAPWGRPSQVFPRGGPWPRSPGEIGSRQEMTKILQ